MDILLVDDERGLLDQAKIFLEKFNDGLNVDTAICVEKGLENIDENEYDAVVSDYQMPEIDGLEFLEIIREDKCMDIPFIMFTGKGREEVAMEALNLGADRYLQKGGDARSQYGILADAVEQEVNLYHGEKAKKKLSSIVESSQNAIIGKDFEGKIFSWNKGAEEIYGYTEEEVKGKHISIIAPENKKSEINDILEKVKKGERVKQFETTRVTKEGEKISISLTVSPIFNKNDEVVGASAIARDITEKKHLKEDLKRSEKRFRRAIEEAPYPTMIHAEDGEVISVNKIWTEITGYEKEDIPTIEEWLKKAYSENIEKIKADINGLYDIPDMKDEGVYRITTENGVNRDWDFKSSNIGKLKDGRSLILSMANDITDLKRTEEQLRRSEQKYKAITEKSHDTIFIVGEEEVLFVNDKATDFTGYSKKELYEMDFWELIYPDDRKKVKKIDERGRTGKDSQTKYEARIVTKDNKIKYGDFMVTLIEYKGRYAVLGSVRDITDLKEAEKDLDEMEERKDRLVEGIKRYRNLIEASPDTILLIDTESGKVIDANQRAEDLFKMKRGEIIDKNISELIPADEKESYDKIFGQWNIGSMDKGKNELHILDKEGNTTPVEIGTSSLELEGKNVIFGVFRNITKRKEAEERQEFLHSLLRHDVRNKVSIVHGYLELIMDEDYDLPESVEDYLLTAVDGVKESMEIINKVSSLRKAQEEDVKNVNIDEIVKEVLDHTRDMANDAGIDITCELSERGQKVQGGSLLDQVFTNIIENAIQHSGATKLKIHCKSTEDNIIYTMEDDGNGISDEEKKKIFKRGYTTDEERGTGLGMFLVKKLLEIYEGKIELKDSEMGGTRFDVILKKV